MKLNLGCGNRHMEGYVNVDREPKCNPDVNLDLDTEFVWPFDAESVDEIVASHVMEHLHNFVAVMQECYRVMKPGAKLHITVPHHFSESYWGDPTHVRPITMPCLELFSKKKCAEFRNNGWANTPLADYLNVDFEIENYIIDLMPAWRNKGLDTVNLTHAAQTYNNVINQTTFILKRV